MARLVPTKEPGTNRELSLLFLPEWSRPKVASAAERKLDALQSEHQLRPWTLGPGPLRPPQSWPHVQDYSQPHAGFASACIMKSASSLPLSTCFLFIPHTLSSAGLTSQVFGFICPSPTPASALGCGDPPCVPRGAPSPAPPAQMLLPGV